MRSLIIAAAACAALVACKKADKKEGATAATPGAPLFDPWASGPPAQASTLGASTGDDIAKLDVGKLAAQPQGAMKVEMSSIAAAKADAPLRSFAGISQTGFRVVYNPSSNQIHEGMREALSSNHVFETLAEALNKLVRLPDVVDVQLVDCNTVNAFYDPTNHRIIVCYELMTYFARMFKGTITDQDQLGMAVIGATTFAFFHEVGHGLIHILDLPAVGREEDSVDQLATLILIADGDAGVGLALSGAHWFQLQQQGGQNETPFYDEHAFDMQRFYNILCMIYGSDPQKYGELVTSNMLPQARAARCPDEYAKISKAWEKLLQPHLTNDAAENVDYAPPINPAETKDPWGGPAQPGEPAPPPPQPTGHAITCEAVAEKSLTLIVAEAEKQAADFTEEQIEELKTRLEAELPAVAEQFLAQCAKEDWPDRDRQCVLDADTLDQATKCGIQ